MRTSLAFKGIPLTARAWRRGARKSVEGCALAKLMRLVGQVPWEWVRVGVYIEF